MRIKNTKRRKAQVVIEYVLIFAIVIVAIVSVGFLPKIKANFSNHYDKCVDVILERG